MLTAPVVKESRPDNAVNASISREGNLGKVSEPWTPEFISVGFIAKGCGVSNTTVLRWISTRQLPAFRLPGGHYRIERDDLSKFMAKHNIPVGNK